MGIRKFTETKQCQRCGQERSIGNFAKRTRGFRSATCLRCFRKKARPRRYENWRRNKIRYQGEPFTVAHFDALYAKQEGRCAICRLVPEKTLHVDHWHDSSGEARALLCSFCNLGLGQFKDRPLLLLRAAHYIAGNIGGTYGTG